MKRHFEPKKVIIAERLKFHHRDQAEGESIADYIAALRNIAIHCAFSNNLNEALGDVLFVAFVLQLFRRNH